MLILLHKQATTTPRVRAAIQASTKPGWVLAERYGTTEQTIWKWRKRDTVQDRSHTPHRLQSDAEQKTIPRGIVFPLNADPGARGGCGGPAQAEQAVSELFAIRHWASLHSLDKIAPSKPGSKHLTKGNTMLRKSALPPKLHVLKTGSASLPDKSEQKQIKWP